jgi:hypothetical protein
MITKISTHLLSSLIREEIFSSLPLTDGRARDG